MKTLRSQVNESHLGLMCHSIIVPLATLPAQPSFLIQTSGVSAQDRSRIKRAKDARHLVVLLVLLVLVATLGGGADLGGGGVGAVVGILGGGGVVLGGVLVGGVGRGIFGGDGLCGVGGQGDMLGRVGGVGLRLGDDRLRVSGNRDLGGVVLGRASSHGVLGLGRVRRGLGDGLGGVHVLGRGVRNVLSRGRRDRLVCVCVRGCHIFALGALRVRRRLVTTGSGADEGGDGGQGQDGELGDGEHLDVWIWSWS